MSLLPGLCGEVASTPLRILLGTLPTLAVEERLVRQMQPVHAWYATRKRIKEQANEFIEVDLASCDAELLLRYCHVYYVRRQVFAELLDKQFTLIETGKSVKLADSALLSCLVDCNRQIDARHEREVDMLENAKQKCNVPNRRELSPNSAIDVFDYLCMMRVVEEDMCKVHDAEMIARAFLPKEAIQMKLNELAVLLLGSHRKMELDKKDIKLITRMIPNDYNKVGVLDKWRPVDVSAYYAFCGEKFNSFPVDNLFGRYLWAHIFRKFATHSSYLESISHYWAHYCKFDKNTSLSQMPHEVACAVCLQQSLFPAIKFRAAYMYTSPDIARRHWRSDGVIPLLRLFPVLGNSVAHHLAAGVLVESEWAKMELSDVQTNLLQERVVRGIREMVEQASTLYSSNPELILHRVQDGMKVLCKASEVMEQKYNSSNDDDNDNNDDNTDKYNVNNKSSGNISDSDEINTVSQADNDHVLSASM